MKLGAIVLGYHGCDRKVGESLISGETDFKASQNAHDWLGEGIYFWENNPERAMRWAEFMSRHPTFKSRVSEPFVVGAVIELGNCLDLTEATSLSLVKTAHSKLVEVFKKADTSLPENKKAHDGDADLVQRYLDCAVINHLHSLRKEKKRKSFTTVRGSFHRGRRTVCGRSFSGKNSHSAVCSKCGLNSRDISAAWEIPLREVGNFPPDFPPHFPLWLRVNPHVYAGWRATRALILWEIEKSHFLSN